jgi:hypothetical protein
METALQLKNDSEKLWREALELRLRMTVEERIEAHEHARQLFEDLQKAAQELRAIQDRSKK